MFDLSVGANSSGAEIVSKINDKLGLRPAGKRRMMNIPKDRAVRDQLTSAKCLECGHSWHVQNVINGRLLRMCAWCSRTTDLSA